jgi:asparagine N-glycosylation enzyme membrane subunit Stt3
MSEKHSKTDEEDTAIDFSKVKAWFQSKGKKEHTHTEHHTKHESKEEDEEVKLDYKSTIHFFKKYSTIFLILIPIIVTIYFRLQPMYLPTTDDWATNAVYNYYKGQISTQISQQYPNLPDTNKQALIETEFNKFLTQNEATVKQQIAGTSQHFKDQMMYDSGNSKYVYLGDIDSYFWLRDARNYIQSGYMCDYVNVSEGTCYGDAYTLAPIMSKIKLGSSTIGTNSKMYSYIIAWTYKVLKMFNSDMTIMQASFYVPLIFGIITAILAFLIGAAIAGNIGGFFTSLFLSVSPIYLSRTLGSDNDPISVFFPLLIVLFFIYTFEAINWKKQVLFGSLTGLSISLYAAAWTGWWFMFNFIIATLFIYAGFFIVRQILKHKKIIQVIKSQELKSLIFSTVLIIVTTILFITLISGFGRFLSFITGMLWFTQTKVASLQSFWPNVLVTVAEFNPGSIGTIISQMGGKLLFFLGLMGVLFIMTIKQEKMEKEMIYVLGFGALIYLILVSTYGASLGPITYMALLGLPVVIGMLFMLKSEKEADIKLAILLVIWFVATTYAALKGVRFTLLMASAFSVSFGITIAAIYKTLSRWISTELKIDEIITKSVIVILLLLLLIAPVKAGYSVAKGYIPSVNDAWYNSLTKIKENSQPDAILNSWWDFGHWFKYIADRRVTLDGSSQGGPPLHWLGKLMVTSDEKQSVGILRMLDCGSNTAFDKLNPILNDTSQAVNVLDEIVTLDKEEARDVLLKNGLTKNQAAIVLNYTHCTPPEDFFITSEDMVGKAGVWAHFGSWDFTRAEMYTRVKGTSLEEGKKILMNKEYNLTAEQADKYYYEIQTEEDSQWISPWPGYMSGITPCEKPNEEGTLVCNQQLSNGQQIPLAINLVNMDVKIPATEEYYPTSIVYVTENGTEEKTFSGNLLPFSIVLIPKDNTYYSLVTHPALANSMFTRLFYLEGHGLRYFDKFDDQTGITGGRVIVWKVDWTGKDSNQAYKPLEKEASISANETNVPVDKNTTKKTSITNES